MAKPILLLDDALASLAGLVRALTKAGYECVVVTSDAAAELERSSPQLVFLSLQADGATAACDAMRNKPSGAIVPILFVGTGKEEISSPAHALGRGADFYYQHPVPMAAVMEKVKTYIGAGNASGDEEEEEPASDATRITSVPGLAELRKADAAAAEPEGDADAEAEGEAGAAPGAGSDDDWEEAEPAPGAEPGEESPAAPAPARAAAQPDAGVDDEWEEAEEPVAPPTKKPGAAPAAEPGAAPARAKAPALPTFDWGASKAPESGELGEASDDLLGKIQAEEAAREAPAETGLADGEPGDLDEEAAAAEADARAEAEEKARAEAEAEEKARAEAEAEEKARAEAEAEEKARAEAEAEEKARAEAEEEARLEAEAQARQKAEEEGRRRADEAAAREADLRRQIEEEYKSKAEEKRRKAEEAKRKAEEDAKRRADDEARQKADEEARQQAEQEARLKAEEEARQQAEEEARSRAEEEEAQRAEEEARVKAEEEARQQAEEEARLRAEEEARLRAEEETRRRDAEAKRAAEAKRQAEAKSQAETKSQAEARAAAARPRETAEQLRARIEAEVRAKLEAEARARAAAQAEAETEGEGDELGEDEEYEVIEVEEEVDEEVEGAVDAGGARGGVGPAARASAEPDQRGTYVLEAPPGREVAPPPPSPSAALAPASAPARPASLQPLLGEPKTLRPKGLTPLTPPEGVLTLAHDMAAVLHAFWTQQASGRLNVLEAGTGRQKAIFFDRGRPVAAFSSQPTDRLEELLYLRGLINRPQYQSVRSQRIDNPRRLGAYLVAEGALKPHELFAVVRGHLEEVLFGLFAWESATFRYVPEIVPEEERVALEKEPPALILEGIRRKQLLERLVRRVGAASSLLAPRAGAAGKLDLEALGLSSAERQLVRLLDGNHSIEDLVFTSGLEAQPVYAALATLLAVGYAEVTVVGIEGVDGRGASSVDAIDATRIKERLQAVRELDYFQVLGIPRTATPFETDRAYERLLKDFAPNRFSEQIQRDFHEDLLEINAVLGDARQVLRDELLRDSYTRNLPA